MKHVNVIPELIADLSRSEKLEIYMKRKNMSFASVAKLIGTSRAAARRLLLEDRISSYRHKQLEQAGISPSLLPLAQDIAPGPKPKVEIEPEPMEHAA